MTCRTQTARRANETLDPDRRQLPRRRYRGSRLSILQCRNEGRGMMLTKDYSY